MKKIAPLTALTVASLMSAVALAQPVGGTGGTLGPTAGPGTGPSVGPGPSSGTGPSMGAGPATSMGTGTSPIPAAPQHAPGTAASDVAPQPTREGPKASSGGKSGMRRDRSRGAVNESPSPTQTYGYPASGPKGR